MPPKEHQTPKKKKAHTKDDEDEDKSSSAEEDDGEDYSDDPDTDPAEAVEENCDDGDEENEEDEECAANDEEEQEEEEEEEDEDDLVDPIHITAQLAGDENCKILHVDNEITLRDFRKKIAAAFGLPAESKFLIAKRKKPTKKSPEPALVPITKRSEWDKVVDGYFEGEDQFLRILVTPAPGTVSSPISPKSASSPSPAGLVPAALRATNLASTVGGGSAASAAAAVAASSPSPVVMNPGIGDMGSPLSSGSAGSGDINNFGGTAMQRSTRPTSSYSREAADADAAIKALFEQEQNGGPEVRWTEMRTLGRGAFGSVHEAITNSGHIVAVKHMTLPAGSDGGKSSGEQVDKLVEEIRLMRNLRHRNIVGFYGSQRKEQPEGGGRTVDIFMEACHGGSLNTLRRKVDKIRGRLPVFLVRSYIKQVLEGLSYLHLKGVCHRDLKGDNVLIDGRGVAKIADFGCSKKLGGQSFEDTVQLEMRELSCSSSAPSTIAQKNDSSGADTRMTNTLVGTPIFIAPEVLLEDNRGYFSSADIWSLGCLVIELFGKKAWVLQNASVFSVIFAIAQSKTLPTGMPDADAGTDSKLMEFLSLCFNRDPTARPTARQLLEHPWITCPEAELREPVWKSDLLEQQHPQQQQAAPASDGTIHSVRK